MGKMVKQKQKQQRQVNIHNVEDYERDGWTKIRNVGQSSAVVEREVEVEVEVPFTRIEVIDQQIEALQIERKKLEDEEQPKE